MLGKPYAEAGVEQGRAALDDFARHPATARHIATKLARHFVADDPPAGLVDALARKFRDSDGDLAVVASALVSDDRAWSAKPTKIRTPLEFIVGAARATGFSPTIPVLPPEPQSARHAALAAWRAQRLFRHERRMGLARRHENAARPRLVHGPAHARGRRAARGPEDGARRTASPETRQAVERAESREQALALLFMAPEFQTEMTMAGNDRASPSRAAASLARRGGGRRALRRGLPPPPASAAGARDPRLVVIILRGALDGLSADSAGRRSGLRRPARRTRFRRSGERAALQLDGFFFAHPALAAFKRMYDEKRAAVIHATATDYRDRSHFDGQDVLESGYPGPGRTDSGWLNRALGALPQSEQSQRGLGVGATAPLVIRGPAPALGWAPPGGLAPAGEDLGQRVLDLYAHRDPPLGESLAGRARGPKGRGRGGDVPAEEERRRREDRSTRCAWPPPARRAFLQRRTDRASPRSPSTASTPIRTRARRRACSRSASRGSTPRSTLLRQISATHGRDTVVVAITEFGRTARVNGTRGTDHGTGTVALLAGGAVAGGRVVADWPGLKPERLYQGRDLEPTTDLRSVLKGRARRSVRAPAGQILAEAIFPDSAPIAPMKGLIA